ncbi:MAG: Gfo/Idh/MocA family oxidoreductase [Verrucomicrobiota bacterium]
MSKELCRWGFLGTAGIARKNWQAVKNAGNATLAAVASRSAERAQAYIDENQAQVPHDPAPQAVGGYDELIKSDLVDAVYIPLPTGLRKDFVLAAAEAGKHVLCEKPCGIDPASVKEMIDACSANGVQFMDGVMFMHSLRMPALKSFLLDEERFGEMRRIATQFSFLAGGDFKKENIRVHSELEPFGSLGDLGWYNIRFALWAMDYVMPDRVTGRLISQQGRPDSPDSVPIDFSGELLWNNGVTASFFCSFDAEHQQWAHVSGTGGSVRIDDFVLPYHGAEVNFHTSHPHFETDLCQFHMEEHTERVAVREYSDSHPTSQETLLFRNFSKIVNSGNLDSHWPSIALQTQTVLNACLDSARDGGREITLV